MSRPSGKNADELASLIADNAVPVVSATDGPPTAGTELPPISTQPVATYEEPPQTGKGKVQAPQKRLPKPDAQLKAMLPPGTRLHIFRKELNGSRTFIQDYDVNDLAGHGTIEAFIQKYIVPRETVIPGVTHIEYALMMQKTGENELYNVSTVRIAVPPATENANIQVTKALLDEVIKTRAQPQQSPMAAITEYGAAAKQIKELFGSSEDSKGSGIDISAIFMMNMMSSMLNPKPQVDPTLEILRRQLEAIERREYEARLLKETIGQPPPPPPPAPDPMSVLGPILSSFTTAMSNIAAAAMTPKPVQERDSLRELEVLTRLIKPDTPPMTVKDVIELFPRVKEILVPKDDQKDGFEKAVEHLKLLRILKEELGGNDREESGFWDFAKSFIQSDLGSQIMSGIKQDQSSKQAKEQKHEDKPLEIPQSFEPYAKKINEAPDLPNRIGATFQGLQHLYTFPGFRPHISQLLDLMKKNEKNEAIKKLREILLGLAEAEAIDKNVVDPVVNGVRAYWVPICQKLGLKHITTDPDPVQKTVTQQPVPPQTQPATTQSAPSGSQQPQPSSNGRETIEVEEDDDDDEAEVEVPEPQGVA